MPGPDPARSPLYTSTLTFRHRLGYLLFGAAISCMFLGMMFSLRPKPPADAAGKAPQPGPSGAPPAASPVGPPSPAK